MKAIIRYTLTDKIKEDESEIDEKLFSDYKLNYWGQLASQQGGQALEKVEVLINNVVVKTVLPKSEDDEDKMKTLELTDLQIKLLKEIVSICDGLAFIVEDNLEDEMNDLKKQLGE